MVANNIDKNNFYEIQDFSSFRHEINNKIDWKKLPLWLALLSFAALIGYVLAHKEFIKDLSGC